jgi:membrane protease YdiL (CAAX protease family)
VAPVQLGILLYPAWRQNGRMSAYHFWSLWQMLTRTVAIAPMSWAVQKNRSLWVSGLTHCLLNTLTMIFPLGTMLK